jgi:hypothetical protein
MDSAANSNPIDDRLEAFIDDGCAGGCTAP